MYFPHFSHVNMWFVKTSVNMQFVKKSHVHMNKNYGQHEFFLFNMRIFLTSGFSTKYMFTWVQNNLQMNMRFIHKLHVDTCFHKSHVDMWKMGKIHVELGRQGLLHVENEIPATGSGQVVALCVRGECVWPTCGCPTSACAAETCFLLNRVSCFCIHQ